MSFNLSALFARMSCNLLALLALARMSFSLVVFLELGHIIYLAFVLFVSPPPHN